MGFLPDELVLGLGSIELVEDLPATFPVELERLNHFVGLDKNWVKPEDGEAERGKLRKPVEGEVEGTPMSGGLNELEDGAPRRRAMARSEKKRVLRIALSTKTSGLIAVRDYTAAKILLFVPIRSI